MNRFYTIKKYIKTVGIFSLTKMAAERIFKEKIDNYQVYQHLFRGSSGIEIGGPSSFFRRKIPIYRVVSSLDNINFAANTTWGRGQNPGSEYNFLRLKKGKQIICDAVNLSMISSGRYDFVLSCHNLEHIANPIKAIKEWLRVIRPEGLILLVLPNKNSNFDRRRNVTSFDHLLADYDNDVSEGDLTHLSEILALHDLSMDPEAGSPEEFEERSRKNVHFRCLHHHVFDLPLLRQLFDYLNVGQILSNQSATEYAILGRKST